MYLEKITAPEGGIKLRYFDSRGRAQALRYALIDAGVEFEDDRISLQHVGELQLSLASCFSPCRPSCACPSLFIFAAARRHRWISRLSVLVLLVELLSTVCIAGMVLNGTPTHIIEYAV